MIFQPARLIATVLGSTLLAALFTGCAISGGEPEFPDPVAEPVQSAALRPYYEQEVDWQKCKEQPDGGPAVYCAEIAVPKNWDDVSAGKFQLAAAFLPAQREAIGSLVFNPGGPGSAATDWLIASPAGLGTEKLRSSFNIVAIDPRGVGSSEPAINCLSDQKLTDLLYAGQNFELGSTEDRQATRVEMRDFFEGCKSNHGSDLALFNTEFAARDLDVVRAVLGETKLNYLGFSYGTQLGATYADLHPKKVGRFVLDGAINPLLSQEAQSLAQIRGFESALSSYLAECLANADCPFKGSVAQAQRQLGEVLKKIERQPLATDDGRKLYIWPAVTGIIMPLYGESWWPTLTDALTQATQGDGTGLLELADIYNDFDANQKIYFSNLVEANIVINCLDARASSADADLDRQNSKVLKLSPVFGRYSLDGALGCAELDYPPRQHQGNYRAEGANTILVVGTTGDPATPYQQAVQLARDVLANARLLTYRGEGHTAYGVGSDCVDRVVDEFFVANVVPAEDFVCEK